MGGSGSDRAYFFLLLFPAELDTVKEGMCRAITIQWPPPPPPPPPATTPLLSLRYIALSGLLAVVKADRRRDRAPVR